MNYIELINLFWRSDDAEGVGAVATRLYFALLNIANRNRWQGEIVIGDKHLSALVGVSLNTFKLARSDLHKRDLIAFSVGGKGRKDKTRYKVGCQDRSQEESKILTPKVTPTPTLYTTSIKRIMTYKHYVVNL